ncbi:MAG: hypothetical protein N4A44_02810 [Alphaproteobacteria bacterium]|jgi:hypothetical protein|nr:hypothetical protein [Alphaproteobacteria bacterium]
MEFNFKNNEEIKEFINSINDFNIEKIIDLLDVIIDLKKINSNGIEIPYMYSHIYFAKSMFYFDTPFQGMDVLKNDLKEILSLIKKYLPESDHFYDVKKLFKRKIKFKSGRYIKRRFIDVVFLFILVDKGLSFGKLSVESTIINSSIQHLQLYIYKNSTKVKRKNLLYLVDRITNSNSIYTLYCINYIDSSVREEYKAKRRKGAEKTNSKKRSYKKELYEQWLKLDDSLKVEAKNATNYLLSENLDIEKNIKYETVLSYCSTWKIEYIK